MEGQDGEEGGFCKDVKNMIYEYCEPLVAFMMEPCHPSIVRRLKLSLKEKVGIQDVDSFLKRMKDYPGAIAGSFMLHFLHGEEETQAADLDIFMKHPDGNKLEFEFRNIEAVEDEGPFDVNKKEREKFAWPGIGPPSPCSEFDYTDGMMETIIYKQPPLKKPIQFVVMKGDYQQHIAKFDCSCLKLFYDGGNRLHTVEGFSMEELQQKMFAPVFIPPRSLYRVAKYVKKGFQLSPEIRAWLSKRDFTSQSECSWTRECPAYTDLRAAGLFETNLSTLQDDVVDFAICPSKTKRDFYDLNKCNFCHNTKLVEGREPVYINIRCIERGPSTLLYKLEVGGNTTRWRLTIGKLCIDCFKHIRKTYDFVYEPCFKLPSPLIEKNLDTMINEYLAYQEEV